MKNADETFLKGSEFTLNAFSSGSVQNSMKKARKIPENNPTTVA